MMTSLSWGDVLANIFIIGKYSGGRTLADDVDNKTFSLVYCKILRSCSGLSISISVPYLSSLFKYTFPSSHSIIHGLSPNFNVKPTLIAVKMLSPVMIMRRYLAF